MLSKCKIDPFSDVITQSFEVNLLRLCGSRICGLAMGAYRQRIRGHVNPQP